MKVYGPAQLHAAQSISAPHTTRSTRSTTSIGNVNTQDEVNISDAAQQVDQTQASQAASSSSGIRSDRVSSIRSQIASGTYETPDKLDAAVSRLLDAIG